MKTLRASVFAAAFWGFLACGHLIAGPITISDLPTGHTDTISIALSPGSGAVHGTANALVGWGFVVNWSSTAGDWISFTSTSLGSLDQGESNPALLASGGYQDFIGTQGGPVDFGLSPGSSPWSQTFDGSSQGVGSYRIANPLAAVPGAQDTGEITFNFQVWNEDPLVDGAQQIGDGSYAYYGTSTQFSVTVDHSVSAAPEPASFALFLAGAGLLVLGSRRRCRSRRNVPKLSQYHQPERGQRGAQIRASGLPVDLASGATNS